MKEVEGSEQGLQGVGEERNARPRVALGEKTSPSLSGHGTVQGPEGVTRPCPAQNGEDRSWPFSFPSMDCGHPSLRVHRVDLTFQGKDALGRGEVRMWVGDTRPLLAASRIVQCRIFSKGLAELHLSEEEALSE